MPPAQASSHPLSPSRSAHSQPLTPAQSSFSAAHPPPAHQPQPHPQPQPHDPPPAAAAVTIPRPRAQPRFYLPSHVSPALSPSAVQPLSSSAPRPPIMSPPHVPHSQSHPSSPYPRGTRGSLAALQEALRSYSVPSPSSSPPPDLDLSYSLAPSSADGKQRRRSISTLSLRGLGPGYDGGGGLGQERMDACVEIHRVLYRGGHGSEEWDAGQGGRGWREEVAEVRRVVDRWFEGDCVYDHPLLRLSSRPSLLAHFALLHLVSSPSLPSITPSALLHHAHSLTSSLRARLLAEEEDYVAGDIERGVAPKDVKAKGKAVEAGFGGGGGGGEWFGLGSGPGDVLEGKMRARQGEGVIVNGGGAGTKGWWKVWEVRAECREIGGMECYDGYHLAMIEQVITLTLLPSLLPPPSHSSLLSTPSTPSTVDLQSAQPPPSYLSKLGRALATEFDGLLRWDLPIQTVVEFNEVGKATRIRDVIDVQDVVESLVPFARRVSWLTRRLSGVLSSTAGSILMALLGGNCSVTLNPPIRVEGAHFSLSSGEKKQLGSAIGLGFDLADKGEGEGGDDPMSRRQSADRRSSSGETGNSLGLDLQGPGPMTVGSALEAEAGMAPDVDLGD